MSAVIGLDHGARRIGVAVGDTDAGLAFARPAIRTRSLSDAVAAVASLAERERAATVVVGLPLNMDGTAGAQARAVREFAAALAALGLAVVLEDERLSSWAADRELEASGRRPSRASGERDSAAARLILQQYLDARRRTAPPEETA